MLIFSAVTTKLDLPPHLLESVCYIESHYRVDAVHKDDGGGDSLGVCQVKLTTAAWLGFKGTSEQLMQPEINALYSGKYLKYNLKRYGNMTRAIVAYNRGNARGLLRSKYSDKVLKQYNKVKK